MHLVKQVYAENQNRMKRVSLVFVFVLAFLARCSSLAPDPDLFVLGMVAEIQHGRSCEGAANDSEWSLLTVDLPVEFLSELESELRPFLSDGKQLWVEGRYKQVADVEEKRKYWFSLVLSDEDGSGAESSKPESTCLRLRTEDESAIKHPEELPRTKPRRQARMVEKEGVCCTHGLDHHKKNKNSFKWCKDSTNALTDGMRNESSKCRLGSVLCCDCCHIGFKASRLGLSYCHLAGHSSSGTCRDVLLDCCFEQTVNCPDLADPANGSVTLSNANSYKSAASYLCELGYKLNGPTERLCEKDQQWSGSDPTCERVSCGSLTNLSNGSVDNNGTFYNSIATYSCHKGYNLVGSTKRTCRDDEQWDGHEPTCKRVSCGWPGVPSNGSVDISAGTSLGDVARYSCNLGYTLDGPAERTCMADKQWSGSVPTCERVSCGHPGSPSDGSVNISAGLFGDVAGYSCNNGYTLDGIAERICQANKQWSGDTPICNRVSCGQPDEPTNSRVDTSDGTNFEDVARYSCHSGYILNGLNESTCQADGLWSGGARTCERVSCSQLDAPSNGHVDTSNGTSFGDVANYSCVNGYVLSGPATRTCQADRQWSGRVPTCERETCGQPGVPANGLVDTSAGTSFGDVTRYSCNTGYTLIGTAERTCQADGMWNGSVPTCEIVDCGRLMALSNGTITLVNRSTTFNSMATYKCKVGFDLVGSDRRTCQDDGQWSGSEPTCERDSCGQPASPSNGRVNISAGVFFGDKAVYSCDVGYMLNGSAERACQAGGQWSGGVPTCERVSCGPLTAPNNGRVDTSDGTSFESMATYLCDEGYKFKGPATTTCQANGQWSEGVPTCEIVDCDLPMDLSNGTFTLVNRSTTFNSMATYECSIGFDLVGSDRRTCQANGRWSGSEPTCQRVSCGEPAAITNGQVDTSDSTSYGAVARYSCETGYKLIGRNNRTCQENGQWSGSVPTCEEVTCEPLVAPSNGVVVPNRDAGGTFGDNVTYSCARGYDLSELVLRTCQADGQWSGRDPTCARVDCGSLTDPSKGRVDTRDGTSYRDVAKYSCNTGYNLTGPNMRTCQYNRVWNGTMPVCQIVDCGPPTLPNGYFTLDSGSTTFGSTAKYNCSAGFKLIGSVSSTCTAEGEWEGSSGRFCREKKTCALPLDIMIVLDHSASIRKADFTKQTEFIRSFVSLLPVARDKIRVGLIRYWYIVELVFDFDDFYDDTALEDVIGALRRPKWRQRTNTGAAIQRMVDTFTVENGARDPEEATRVGIVVTDGKATDSIDAALQAARSKNITIYAYGVGTAFSEGSDELKELQEIATDNTTFEVVDINDLSNLVNRLIDRFVNCDDSPTPPPEPTGCQPMEYFNETTSSCETCMCNGFERTADTLQCDPITGSCICRDEGRRGGPRCDRCIWELRGDDCDMCREGMKLPPNRPGPENCRLTS